MKQQQLQQLIDHHGGALTLFAAQWCRWPDDAVQEALIELVKLHQSPRDEVAWLYQVVRRRAINIARSESRRARHHQSAARQRQGCFQSETFTNGDFEFEVKQLQTELQRLTIVQREIVVARIWGGLTFSQIADLVQEPLSSVHRKYQQALTQLAQVLNKQVPKSQNHEKRFPSCC